MPVTTLVYREQEKQDAAGKPKIDGPRLMKAMIEGVQEVNSQEVVPDKKVLRPGSLAELSPTPDLSAHDEFMKARFQEYDNPQAIDELRRELLKRYPGVFWMPDHLQVFFSNGTQNNNST